MSCFFCESFQHLTQNCDIYASIKSRKIVQRLKNQCINCFASKPIARLWCYNCTDEQKCFICFSRSHHTVYCPDKLAVAFSPNIDRDLLSRFKKLLYPEEIFMISLSCPITFDKQNPLKILYRKYIYFSTMTNFSNYDIVVSDEAYIRHVTEYNSDEIIPTFGSTEVKFHLRKIQIYCPNIFSHEALQLLSRKTKVFKCRGVEFLSKLTFYEIIEAAPNLENLDLRETNVEIDGASWPNVLQQFNNGFNFQYLHLPIADLNFNLESLANLMKRKSSKSFVFYLYFTASQQENFRIRNFFEMADLKFSTHFTPVNRQCQKGFRLHFSMNQKNSKFLKDSFGFRDYVLKN